MSDKTYSMITDIAFLNSKTSNGEELRRFFDEGLFGNENMWNDFNLGTDIQGLMDRIGSRMKYYMSQLSLGVYNVLEDGPGKNIREDDEIYLFSGFTEIGTVSKIGDIIMTNDYSINPSIFPNSVHHISLCYYTILKKLGNYCAAVTDGPLTNFSFINFIKNRVMLENGFIVVTGEERGTFFDYEISDPPGIYPSFAAYKIVPGASSGFYYAGYSSSLEELMALDDFKNAANIFCDRETFFLLKGNAGKNIYSDYPVTGENPCGIIFRLAFPFYFNCAGRSLIVDKIMDKYYYFIVKL